MKIFGKIKDYFKGCLSSPHKEHKTDYNFALFLGCIGLAFAAVTGTTLLLAASGVAYFTPLYAGAFTVAAAVRWFGTDIQKYLAHHPRQKIETVTNQAGQTVQGPKWVLEQLAETQKKITATLTKSFNKAADVVQKKVDKIIKKTAKIEWRATVLDAGNQGAGKDKYEFVKTVPAPTN